MSLLTKLFSKKSEEKTVTAQDFDSEGWVSHTSGLTSPDNKNFNSFYQEATVFSCVHYLASDIAKVPLNVFKVDGKVKELAVKNPLYRIFKYGPNKNQTAFDWKLYAMYSLLYYGNSFNILFFNGNGEVSEFYPIHPSRVTIFETDEGKIFYAVSAGDNYENSILEKARAKVNNKQYFMIPESYMFCLKDLPNSNGLEGVSRITMHKKTIDLALSQREFSHAQVKNSAIPATVLKHPKILNRETGKRLRESWDSIYKGASNNFKTAVLEEGMDIQTLSMSSSDLEFIQQRKMSHADIARIFRVPLSKLSDRDSATYNNAETENRAYLTDSLLPFFVMIEESVSKYLLNRGYEAQFDMSQLTRADTEQRNNGYATGIQNGYLSINDVRFSENLNPIQNGDIHLQPMNFAPLGYDPSESEDKKNQASIDLEDKKFEFEREKIKHEQELKLRELEEKTFLEQTKLENQLQKIKMLKDHAMNFLGELSEDEKQFLEVIMQGDNEQS